MKSVISEAKTWEADVTITCYLRLSGNSYTLYLEVCDDHMEAEHCSFCGGKESALVDGVLFNYSYQLLHIDKNTYIDVPLESREGKKVARFFFSAISKVLRRPACGNCYSKQDKEFKKLLERSGITV